MKSTGKPFVLLLVAFTLVGSLRGDEPSRLPTRPVADASSSAPTAGVLMQVRDAEIEMRLVDPTTKFTLQPPQRSVRLVQADDDLSDLLDNLDPIQNDRPTNGDDGLLDEARDLLKDEAPPARLFPMGEERGREPSDAMRELLKQELDKLLPADRAARDDEADAKNAEPLPSGTEEVRVDDLVDPVPQPIYRRTTPRPNQPYTLAGILADDDRVDPNREAEFCQRMWECAGGKCQRPINRWKRDWRRDRDVIWRGNCGPRLLNPLTMLSLPLLGCRSCEATCTTTDWEQGAMPMSNSAWTEGEPTLLRSMQRADRSEQLWVPAESSPTLAQ